MGNQAGGRNNRIGGQGSSHHPQQRCQHKGRTDDQNRVDSDFLCGLHFFGFLQIFIYNIGCFGKTTIAAILNEKTGCPVVHLDDFFLRPEQRTPERFAEPGGNVDRERFLEEVLIPLSKNEVIQYRRFECSTYEIQPAVEIQPKKLVIIEGAYSMHPELSQYYDLSVFLDISEEFQKKRIEKRNTPPFVKRFLEEWIPMEIKYFSFNYSFIIFK